ncbi:MAG: alpha-L-rhamnosidase C-terminal domain-containing protein, partial [Limisphaerales bacterium]
PQRDERQGWLGDRSEESRGETYIFGNAPLYAKWLGDMADAQRPSGSMPDIAPAYWPIYSDDVVWPSTSIIIPEMLREQYGDTRVVARHYACMKKWMDYVARRYLTNGIIAKDSYGDWCAPPRDRARIWTQDPDRMTSGALLATAYFYHDCRLMENYARLLDKPSGAAHFAGLASNLKTAFNEKFLNRNLGRYNNGSETSDVLPLAFDLVPDDMRKRIFDHLVNKIMNDGDHIGVGLVGGQYLMRVLTRNGRPDLAYAIAGQTTYPSWGYMIENGATTIWELWNGNTADQEMNSRNHVMLVGDLVVWLYEDLAGIKSDPAAPGFKHVIMKPHPVHGLTFVRAAHVSPYGLIVSDWRRNGTNFHWRITVPVNATASVYVPASSPGHVYERGAPAARNPFVKFLRMDGDYAVFNVGSGTYRFTSQLR